jgi:predicted cupin superfamily sugar epimerase
MRARALIEQLHLEPHPEGGNYREIYRSSERVQTARGIRSAITAIYYLLERSQIARWHVVEADEIWHFYEGSARAPGLRSASTHARALGARRHDRR